ncbi:glutathione S-transferase [Paraburkholderia monticola]|uniref:Glutathione S-transferase n=1 Tax=Paraburkholderia monticola TaxID=1399968 RepID=A0A149PFD5_9BURK|nr:glutathione S-transferase family protein [Paraburkholderia monticola]KXU83728.1 glutathione S-transferase [Paraburkholderia monticola]
MKLYYAETLAPRKACAVARYLKMDIEHVFVDLGRGDGEQRRPYYLAINPNGTVPSLVDGDIKLWEADAIICHLAHHSETGLWPRNAQQQIDVVRWLSWNNQHLYRHGNALYFEHLIKQWLGMGGPDPSKVEEAQDLFRKHASVLDQHLKGRKWLLGDDLSVADFSVAVTLPYAKSAAIPLDEFSEVRRWHDQLNAFEAWRNPFPARPIQVAAQV